MPIIIQPPMQPSFKERIAKARLAMEYIPKRGWNAFHQYHYVEAGDVQGQCGKILAEHGIVLRKQNETVEYDTVKTAKGNEEVRCRVSLDYGFEDVHSDQVIWYSIHGEGRDTGDKAYNKALTSARKYFLIDALCLGIGDDPEASGDEEREGKRDIVKRGKVAIVTDRPAQADKPILTLSEGQASILSALFTKHKEITGSGKLLDNALEAWKVTDLIHLQQRYYQKAMDWLNNKIADAEQAKANGSAMREPGED